MKKLFVFLLITSMLSTNVKACDPWIVNAYNLILKRAPTTSECTITNFNNGSWNSYAQLVSLVYNYASGFRGDPWVIQVYYELYNRLPRIWELNIKNYNNGSWSSYANLKTYIQEYQTNMWNNGITVQEAMNSKGNVLAFYFKGTTFTAVDELSKSASIIAAGGGNIVAGGGGNIIAATNNIVAGGGGNFYLSGTALMGLLNPVAGGGNSNMTVTSSMITSAIKGVSFVTPGVYTLSSTTSPVIKTSGTGSIQIK
jgi:hypothetical protein